MKHRNAKYTGMALVAFILICIVIVALGYGVTVGLCGLVMWALAKLSIIGAWTWGQAALWGLVVYIVWMLLKSIFGSGKSDD